MESNEPNDRAEDADLLLAQARGIQRRITALYGELASAPGPDASREALLAELLEARRSTVYRLGLALLRASFAHDGAPRAVAPIPENRPGNGADTPIVLERLDESRAVPEPTPAPVGAAAPEVVEPPTAPAVAPDAQTLARLAENGLGPRWEQDLLDEATSGKLLSAVMDALGPPDRIDDDEALDEEARRICRESDRLDRWLSLDRHSQQLLLSYAAAKARYLQEIAREGHVDSAAIAGLDPAFRAMNRHSKEHRPGFVWGLSRSHAPKHGHWLEDATQYWQQLNHVAGKVPRVETNPERALARLARVLDTEPPEDVVREATLDALTSGVSTTDPRLLRLLEPYADALTGPALKSLRRALRDATDDGSPDDEGADPPAVDPDWECFDWTDAKVAVIVGGDRRPEAAERIQEAFRFARVEWDSDVQGTRLVNIAERVIRRSVDMVIFLARLSSHGSQAVLLDACKVAGVPFVRVERGYGVTAIRLAIEQLHGQAELTPPQ